MTDSYFDISGVSYDRSLPVFSPEHLQGICSAKNGPSNEKRLKEIFMIFKAECGEQIEALECYSGELFEADLQSMIHFIGGGAANFGFTRLSALCRAVETAILRRAPYNLDACKVVIKAEYGLACRVFSTSSLVQ